MKILIAQDSRAMRHVLQKHLEAMGFDEIVPFADGDETLEWLEAQEEMPGLIVLDWNMPRMNGIEVLEHLRSHATTRSIPVIMVSAESDKESVLEAIQAGANDYMIKPVKEEEFRQKVERLVHGGGVRPDAPNVTPPRRR